MKRPDAPEPRRPVAAYAQIDVLRGWCCLGVIVFHASLYLPEPGPDAYMAVYTAIARKLYYAVDVFFVVSGFLIGRGLLATMARPDYYRHFYARRARRIFPLYFTFLAATAALALSPAFAGAPGWKQFCGSALPWASVFLLNARFAAVGFGVAPVVVHQFWSLSVEEQFYAVAPAFLRFGQRHGLARVVAAAVLAVGAAAVVGSRHWPLFFSKIGFAAGSVPLLLGVLIAALESRPRALRRLLRLALAGCALALACAFASPGPAIGLLGCEWVGAVSGAAALVVACVSAAPAPPRDGRQRAAGRLGRMGRALLGHVGRRCYGVYVFQQVVIAGIAAAAGAAPLRALVVGYPLTAQVAAVATTLALSTAAAAVSWRWLESRFVAGARPGAGPARRSALAPAAALTSPRAAP